MPRNEHEQTTVALARPHIELAVPPRETPRTELTPWRRRNSLYTAVKLLGEKLVDEVRKDDVDEEATIDRFHELGDLVAMYFEARAADQEHREGRTAS